MGAVAVFFMTLLCVLGVVLAILWPVYAQLKRLIEGQKRLEELHIKVEQMLSKIERHSSQLAECFEAELAAAQAGKRARSLRSAGLTEATP